MSEHIPFGRSHKHVYIVIIGRPNVGKSTLLRVLFGIHSKVGKKPGVTKKIRKFFIGNSITIVDFPGFGIITGKSKRDIDYVKNKIVQYIETESEKIDLAILVINAVSFIEVWNRSIKKGIIPIDFEFLTFLKDLGIPTIVVLNKIDKISKYDRSHVIESIVNLLKPALDNEEKIIPVSLKTKEGMSLIRKELYNFLKSRNLTHLMKYIKK